MPDVMLSPPTHLKLMVSIEPRIYSYILVYKLYLLHMLFDLFAQCIFASSFVYKSFVH